MAIASYKNWKDAHTHAVKLARELNREVGIEAGKEYDKPMFLVHMLPKRESRYGFELRCEVVSPSDPL